MIAERLDRRDSLNGAWWPHSLHAAHELPPLLRALGTRFRSVLGVTLNRDEWPDTDVGLDHAAGLRTKVSWYGLTDSNLALIHLDGQRRVRLLVVRPDLPERIALDAMLIASTPGNNRSPEQVLAHATSGEPQG